MLGLCSKFLNLGTYHVLERRLERKNRRKHLEIEQKLLCRLVLVVGGVVRVVLVGFFLDFHLDVLRLLLGLGQRCLGLLGLADPLGLQRLRALVVFALQVGEQLVDGHVFVVELLALAKPQLHYIFCSC